MPPSTTPRTKLDGLSTVFNNAGASNLSQVHDWPVDEWDRIVRLNLGGVFHGIKATAPHLLAGGGGSIVSTASISGTRPSAGEAPYSAAKAGVVALTANAAHEYAPTVRANAVSPGMIHTGLTDVLLTMDGMPEHMAAKTPLGSGRDPRGHRRRRRVPQLRSRPLRHRAEHRRRRRDDAPRRRRRRPLGPISPISQPRVARADFRRIFPIQVFSVSRVVPMNRHALDP